MSLALLLENDFRASLTVSVFTDNTTVLPPGSTPVGRLHKHTFPVHSHMLTSLWQGAQRCCSALRVKPQIVLLVLSSIFLLVL